MGGGGGTSGKIDFPDHMKELHKDWFGYISTGVDSSVSTDLVQVMNSALGSGGNPYEGVTYVDPSTVKTDVDTLFNDWETMADGLDEITDFNDIIDNAIAKIEGSPFLDDIDRTSIISAAKSGASTNLSNAIESALDLLDDQVIIEQVKAFSRRASYERNNAVRRFSGQMADVNAVQGSAYMLGVALIEAQHIQSVDEYQAELNNQLLRDGVQSYIRMYTSELTAAIQIEVQNQNNGQRILISSNQIMASILQNKIQFQQALTQVRAEIERVFLVAEAEYTANEADIANRFAQWDFKVFNMATNVLGGMGGGQRLPEGTSKAGSAIGGALSGAATGAAVGSVVPGIGTAAGAGIGAALGLGAGLFG